MLLRYCTLSNRCVRIIKLNSDVYLKIDLSDMYMNGTYGGIITFGFSVWCLVFRVWLSEVCITVDAYDKFRLEKRNNQTRVYFSL